MEKLPDGAENIATLKVKWDPNTRKSWSGDASCGAYTGTTQDARATLKTNLSLLIPQWLRAPGLSND
jgi:hypothetical protein